MIAFFVFSIILFVAGFGIFFGGIVVGALSEGPMHVARSYTLIKRGTFIAIAAFVAMAVSGVLIMYQNGVFG